jgi:hypothetical protein
VHTKIIGPASIIPAFTSYLPTLSKSACARRILGLKQGKVRAMRVGIGMKPAHREKDPAQHRSHGQSMIVELGLWKRFDF